MHDKKHEFTFIDLFAGIGGFRVALERLGGKCVFSCEIDEHACRMYKENFGDNPYCDITKIDAKRIPDFDILCAGFPCQTFSICGKQHGFYDSTKGTLFFDICRVLQEKKPTAFILENVQNLEKHNKGKTLTIMIDVLNKLGYSVSYKVLNAKDFGVPQNRERVVIIGNKKGIYFNFPKITTNYVNSMKNFLDKENTDFEVLQPTEYTLIENTKRQEKSDLIFCGYRNKNIRNTGVRAGTEHLSRVHKQPNRIYSAMGVHPTLASQEVCGRYFIFVNNVVRKLTIDECYRFMGFPPGFKKIGTKAKLYERIGNSVCVNMIVEVGEQVIKQIFTDKGENEMTVEQYLEDCYRKAQTINLVECVLPNEIKKCLSTLAEKEDIFKGVYTVTVTSLTYKALHQGQDIRRHQIKMEGGYSGRTFDTRHITPFLTNKRFLGAMKESGWLTRSLEQNSYYDFNFKGAINNTLIKKSFLSVLDYVQLNPTKATEMLILLFSESIKYKSLKDVVIVNPIQKESKFFIDAVIDVLHEHFYYKYNCRGASILPVLAIQSIYECIIPELSRFKSKSLDILGSHNSCDNSSGSAGDIVVRNANKSLYEVVEVKFDIIPNLQIVENAYKKIKSTTIQRYYILSTKHCSDNEKKLINRRVEEIGNEHGCQLIINGVFETIKYYLRLVDNVDLFIEKYINHLRTNTELNAEHKIAWNIIMKRRGY